MLAFIISPAGFLIIPTLFIIGGLGSLFFKQNDHLANLWISTIAMLASLWGLFFSLLFILFGQELVFSFAPTSFPLLSLSFHIDLLAGFFVFIISLISIFCSLYGLGYLTHFYKKYNIAVFGFFFNFFLGSLFLVVTASNAVFFLIAWEIMSVASYFMVVYDRHDKNNIKAGLLYLIMTYVGTAFIILAFLLLYKYTNSFEFAEIKNQLVLVPTYIKDLVFVFTLIGFGTKAGIIPLHIWLPDAHPAAPTQVSAIMSGVMIKSGIYMMIRLFMDILQPIPLWWGVTILVIGIISSLLGVLYALTEHDIKRLLAYHSIENIGIILLGLGSALIFYTLNLPELALLGLIAALFHTVNHAIFKSLLFLSAGSVINAMHTRNMEEYGGLIKYMPQTALFFLIGSMAISALPPFNGFFSEWLIFQTLFQGITELNSVWHLLFIVAVGSLALTGGLALACFVKAFGAIFLARPRSVEVLHAKESPLSMRLAMGGLSLMAIIFGLFSGTVIIILEKVSTSLTAFSAITSPLSVSASQKITIIPDFGTVSAPIIFITLGALVLIILFLVKSVIYKKQTVKIGRTWDCGSDLDSRMEITATGFARSIVVIFKGILKPSLQQKVEYHDADSRFLQKSRTVTMQMGDVYYTYFYNPLYKIVNGLSLRVRKIQNGNINAYISYIFGALIVALFSVL